MGERVAIVGSRDFPNLDQVQEYVRTLPAGTIVVSGGARGVDSTAEDEARRCGLTVVSIRPDWERYGKRAGFLRNKDIVIFAEKVVAFWDGKSKGTAHSIELAKDYGTVVEVYGPTEP